MAQGFDFVAEKFYADGEVVADGENVEDSSSAGELTGDADGVGGFVAKAEEFFGSFAGVYFVAGREGEGVLGDVEGVEGAFEGGLRGGDDDAGGGGGEEPEGAESVGEGDGFGGGVFKERGESGGENMDVVGVSAVEYELGFPGEGCVVVANDEEGLAGSVVVDSGDEAGSSARCEL